MAKPWAIGEEATYVVGIRGTLDARDDDTVTIGGRTLPTKMGAGVVYASIDLPPEPCHHDGMVYIDDFECPSQHVDDADWSNVEQLVDLLRAEHDAQSHSGPFQFCRASLCAAAQGVRTRA